MDTNIRVVGVERVDDIPVLFTSLKRLRVAELLDRHFPRHEHHLWKGELTFGEVVCLWLIFITSEGDHRLSKLEGWVEDHLLTLQACLGKPIRPLDCQDDRLADVLDALQQAEPWQAFEEDLNAQTVRVYRLEPSLFRLDMTTASSYAQVLSEHGLIQFGHSKDNDDLPQLKIAVAALDPLGMPVTTAVVAGNSADDPLYVPVIKKVQGSFGRGGHTYVSDCKGAALETRAYLAQGVDYYLCPLSATQVSKEQLDLLLQPVWQQRQALQQVYRPRDEGNRQTATGQARPHQPASQPTSPDKGSATSVQPKEASPGELVAEGFSFDVTLQAVLDKKLVQWTERRWLVRSVAHAEAQQEQLEKRLKRASEQLDNLNVRKQGKKVLNAQEMAQAAQDIVEEQRVEGLLNWSVQSRTFRWKRRKYRDRPAQMVTEKEHRVEQQRQEEAIERIKRAMGWRVYATNELRMTLGMVVWGYRGQYRAEGVFSRFKGKSLSLTPMYLATEERMEGLVLLLSVALRLLTLLEWLVRKKLKDSGETLKGVHPGQPGRQSKGNSAEMLLQVFKGISLTVLEIAGRLHAFITPLSPLQKKLLSLWDLPSDLYQRLASLLFPDPPPLFSER